MLLVPASDEIEALVVRQLGASSLFAARFREVATRALLLPRRGRPDRRAPLWQQRKRSSDLLAVAARFGSFPMLLETYRECLLDIFDMPALTDVLRSIENRTMRLVLVDMDRPSPFAGSLLFRYVASFLYDGDAPLAERRAQALSIDQSQLRELLGEAELRELLDSEAIEITERRLQKLDEEYQVRHADGVHDLLLSIGDLSRAEIRARCSSPDADAMITALLLDRRIIEVSVAGEKRMIAIEDASRYRDALGAPLPNGIPERLLQPVADPLGDLLSRYARTHGPFTSTEVGERFGLGRQTAEMILHRSVQSGRVIEGEFRPGGTQREWCDANVLRALRRRSLAALRHEIEPVEQKALARMELSWQGIGRNRSGLNALLEVIESLQGSPIAASILETDILPARLPGYSGSELDTLTAAGEVVWIGLEPLGERDGRLALYLVDSVPLLHRPVVSDVPLSEKEARIVEHLRSSGASFFPSIHAGIGDGFPNDTLTALWNLVWRGLITNDTFHALRGFARPKSRTRPARAFRSRRGASTPPAGEGRWSLTDSLPGRSPSPTEKSAALAPAIAESLRRPHARGRSSGKYRRRFQRRLRSAEGDGTERKNPSGLLCGRPRGHTIRDSRSAGSASLGSRGQAKRSPWCVSRQRIQRTLTAALCAGRRRQTRPGTDAHGRCPGHSGQRSGSCIHRQGGKEISLMLPENEPERSTVAEAVARDLVPRFAVAPVAPL